jgi:hypothetical protein
MTHETRISHPLYSKPPHVKRLTAALLFVFALAGCNAGIEGMIRERFPHDPDRAVRIARCESGLNPHARNGQYLGLFQLGSYHYWRFGGKPWNDPVVNIDAAAALQAEQGWQPWSCR